MRNEIEGALEEVRRQLNADAAIFVTFREYRGNPEVFDVYVAGEARNWRSLSGTKFPEFDNEVFEKVRDATRGQWCMKAPAPHHENAFAWLEDDFYNLRIWKSTDAYRRLFAKNDFRHTAHSILVDGEIVLGWCGFGFRTVRDHAKVKSIADRSVGTWRAFGKSLIDTKRNLQFLILNSKGNPLAVDDQLLEQIAPATLKQICGEVVERCPRGGLDAFRFDRFEVFARQLDGLFGEFTVVAVRSLSALKTDRFRILSKAQEEIARSFAAGVSSSEIASQMGLSKSTVKYHLRNIYEVLRISSQVELAQMIETRDRSHALEPIFLE